MKRKLNATAIRNAKSKEKPFKLADGGGLYLEVKPSGGKFWRYRYRVMGKENIFAIGSLMDASLEEARKHHEAARKLVSKDIHPAHERKAEKERLALESKNTYKATRAPLDCPDTMPNQFPYHGIDVFCLATRKNTMFRICC